RSQMVHLFDSLVRTIPDGVILTGIKQEGEKLTLEGRSQSNSRVSTYMRNLEGSGWMTRPDLSIIEARDGVAGLPYAFVLSVQLANPNAPKDEDGDGIPDPVPPVNAEPAAPTPVAAATPEGEPAIADEPALEPAAESVPAQEAGQCGRRKSRCGRSIAATRARGRVSTRSASACCSPP